MRMKEIYPLLIIRFSPVFVLQSKKVIDSVPAPNDLFIIFCKCKYSSMSSAFRRLSQELKQHPLRTNIILSSCIGFCGDIMCQTVYDPFFGVTRVTPTSLPPESFASPLVLHVLSPSLVWKKYQLYKKNISALSSCEANQPIYSDGKSSAAPLNPTVCTTLPTSSFSVEDCRVYLDLRRSCIFCSFSCLFSVPYFLWVYRHLDRFYPPANGTKLQAIGKGFASYCAANLSNPLYMAHVTFLDRFFIYRDGRDGRRRVRTPPHVLGTPLAVHSSAMGTPGFTSNAISNGRNSDSGRQRGGDLSVPSAGVVPVGKRKDADVLLRSTCSPMDRSLRTPLPTPTIILEHDKAFNREEYVWCALHDWKKRLFYDFPDLLRYGIVFWGANWLPMFYYIPPHFRLLYSAVLQTVWSGIMSYVMHRGEK